MIQINLLPGARKKTRGRGMPRVSVAGLASGALSRVKNPYLILAVVAGLAGAAAIGGMYTYQAGKGRQLDAQLQSAEQDSIRFAAVIRERRKIDAQRDSVQMQLTLIRSIDGKRYVWPHILDEVSRALPPYTWLTQVTPVGAPDQAVAAAAPPPPAPAPAPAGDTAAKNNKKKRPSAAELADSLQAADRVEFHIVGNTVDIQALTRFMKLLEASPFVENVQLIKSAMIIVDGKEVTEFQLNAAYQRPDSSAIHTVTLSVR